MPAVHFSPWQPIRRPCWHCVSFRGMLYEGSAARCALPNSAAVRSMPADGCSGFAREVGSDDVPEWEPECAAATVRPGASRSSVDAPEFEAFYTGSVQTRPRR